MRQPASEQPTPSLPTSQVPADSPVPEPAAAPSRPILPPPACHPTATASCCPPASGSQVSWVPPCQLPRGLTGRALVCMLGQGPTTSLPHGPAGWLGALWCPWQCHTPQQSCSTSCRTPGCARWGPPHELTWAGCSSCLATAVARHRAGGRVQYGQGSDLVSVIRRLLEAPHISGSRGVAVMCWLCRC